MTLLGPANKPGPLKDMLFAFIAGEKHITFFRTMKYFYHFG